MSAIRFGCQTYTWQMSYQRYRGQIPHIVGVVAQAGFVGLEPEVCMLGDYERDPALLADALAERGIALAALTLVCDWRGASESAEERRLADWTLSYLAHLPGTLLGLCQMPGADHGQLAERQRNALACVHAVGRRAAERGIVCAFHPNSPPGSIFRDAADYAFLLEHLDTQAVGFMPDMGHIAKGGMDPLVICRTYRATIRHVHFKDIDAQGDWTAMGRGVIDWPAIVRCLAATRYDGWIMVEEESAEAERHPDEVTLANGAYVRDVLMPCLGGQRQEPSA
jgi:inosose dehydratase